MSLVNVSLKIWSLNNGIYASIFCWKTVCSFCMWLAFAKATHIFVSKNTCELDSVLTRTVNVFNTNELVKLTTLWTILLRMPNSVDPDEMGLMMSHLIWMLNSVEPYEMVHYDNGRTCSCIGHAEPRLTLTITKTCLYNLDPLKPHFYIVKLGFTGVYIFFLISAQKHRLWVLVRTASSRRF